MSGHVSDLSVKIGVHTLIFARLNLQHTYYSTNISSIHSHLSLQRSPHHDLSRYSDRLIIIALHEKYAVVSTALAAINIPGSSNPQIPHPLFQTLPTSKRTLQNFDFIANHIIKIKSTCRTLYNSVAAAVTTCFLALYCGIYCFCAEDAGTETAV